MGYHKINIEKGVFGEASKISEEYNEWLDAKNQDIAIMELVELSDMIGAMEGYIEKRFGMSIINLLKMSEATKSAFKDGTRQ